jgi:hypothetical protein
MFRSTTIIRELVLSLAKVILKHSIKYVIIYFVVVLFTFELIFLSINEVSHSCFQCSKHG